MKLRIYGASDDLIEIEKEQDGKWEPLEEIGGYDTEIKIIFEDGTEILCGYPKKSGAIWWIKILKQGSADQTLTACNNEDDEIYSDIFVIDLDEAHSTIIWRKSNTPPSFYYALE